MSANSKDQEFSEDTFGTLFEFKHTAEGNVLVSLRSVRSFIEQMAHHRKTEEMKGKEALLNLSDLLTQIEAQVSVVIPLTEEEIEKDSSIN